MDQKVKRVSEIFTILSVRNIEPFDRLAQELILADFFIEDRKILKCLD